MNQEDRHNLIEEGQAAVATLGLVKPLIEAHKVRVLTKLVGVYRAAVGQNVAHDVLVGGIAELSALDAMINHLESTITKANVAAAKEFDNE